MNRKWTGRAGRLLALLAGLAGASTVSAVGMVALGNNTLMNFDSATPATIASTVTITGLSAGENILGIDFRPATGQLYGLGSTSRLYTINPATGAATALGSAPFTPALTGTSFGFDFNPTVDRVRVVSGAGQNLRLNPDTGAVAATDAALNPGSPTLVASAYTNNVAGATTTTLYGIDSASDMLVIQNPPNNGTLVNVGTLGVDTSDQVGFDIQQNTNNAFASLTVGGLAQLYSINLTTGAATLIGNIGTGTTAVRGFAITVATPPAVAQPANVFAVTSANNLLGFNAATPGTIASTVAITGLLAGETVQGIDFRPATGQLYALGSTSRIYTIDTITGAATQVGAAGAFTLTGTSFGFDFNPVPDRIRVTSNGDQNLRLNPNDGTLTATDGTLAFAAGDVNAAANPNIVASAYTNSAAGATATTLYGIDSNLDILVIQNPPNSGTLNTVGALSVDASTVAGFDILPGTNTAYAVLTVGGTAQLHTINLTTGAATLVGAVGTGAAPIQAMAVAQVGVLQFSAATSSISENGGSATITVTRTGSTAGTVTVGYATSNGTALSTGDYTAAAGTLTFGPGIASQTFTVVLTNDSNVEGDETVNLTLSAPAGGAVLRTQSTAVLTIVNDDQDGGGGGCAVNTNAPLDPLLPLLMVGALFYLARRRTLGKQQQI